MEGLHLTAVNGQVLAETPLKPSSVTSEQVVHLLIWTACFAWLLKINIDWSRNLLPVSVRSLTLLLQQCPIEHNLSVIAFFFFFFFILFWIGAFFYCQLLPGLSRDVIAVLHTADSHGAPEQTGGHIYHLTVCQDDYWIKITIWHFSFSVLAQWTEGKLLQLSMPLSRLLITDLRLKTSRAC